MPQHSIQISKQSEDSQQASIMPQSMSHGQLQSSPKSSGPQQQHVFSDVQIPHEACPSIMLQKVTNSQNRQARMQCTQPSSGADAAFWEFVELNLLFLLVLLVTERLDWSFLCIFWETAAESFLLSEIPCVMLLWIPFALLMLVWPFCNLPVSPSVCSSPVVGWGWVLMRLPVVLFIRVDGCAASRCSAQLLGGGVSHLGTFLSSSTLLASSVWSKRLFSVQGSCCGPTGPVGSFTWDIS